jgi:hypothetical protein
VTTEQLSQTLTSANEAIINMMVSANIIKTDNNETAEPIEPTKPTAVDMGYIPMPDEAAPIDIPSINHNIQESIVSNHIGETGNITNDYMEIESGEGISQFIPVPSDEPDRVDEDILEMIIRGH